MLQEAQQRQRGEREPGKEEERKQGEEPRESDTAGPPPSEEPPLPPLPGLLVTFPTTWNSFPDPSCAGEEKKGREESEQQGEEERNRDGYSRIREQAGMMERKNEGK